MKSPTPEAAQLALDATREAVNSAIISHSDGDMGGWELALINTRLDALQKLIESEK